MLEVKEESNRVDIFVLSKNWGLGERRIAKLGHISPIIFKKGQIFLKLCPSIITKLELFCNFSMQ